MLENEEMMADRSWCSKDGWQHIHPDVEWNYLRMETLRKELKPILDNYIQWELSDGGEWSSADWEHYGQLVCEARLVLTTFQDQLMQRLVHAFLGLNDEP